MSDQYQQFILNKRRSEVATGHSPGPLNEHLFDFQHAVVSWAVRRGRAAIFADTGLGKTLMQLSWADEVARHTGGMGRRFVGTELKPQYWGLACQNIEDAKREQKGLF